jgi:hypothetical protein
MISNGHDFTHLMNNDCNQLFYILHNKSVRKQIQIRRYQELPDDVCRLYQNNDQQYRRISFPYTGKETRFIFKVF